MDEEELLSCMRHKYARSDAYMLLGARCNSITCLLAHCHYTRQQLRILNCPKQFLHSRNTCK